MKLKIPALMLSGFAAMIMMTSAAIPAQAATVGRPGPETPASATALRAPEAQAHSGARAFSEKVRISKPLARALVRRYGPDYSGFYKTRVYCNDAGSGSYSGFNATIQWGGNGSIAIPAYLTVDGTVWDDCGSYAYGYLSYTNGPDSENYVVGTAYYYSSAGVNVSKSSDWFTYGNISIDVCTPYIRWHCGNRQGPGA